MNFLEELANNKQLKNFLPSREVLEIAKKTNEEVNKIVINSIKDNDTKNKVEISLNLNDEVYNIAEKLADNVGNLIEANLEETLKSEELIENYSPKIGDHLYVLRPADDINAPNILSYTHHGIYIGEGKVVHYLAKSVSCDTLQTFQAGYKLRLKQDSPASYSIDEIVRRAVSRLGENNYNVVINNCEHFCRWCRCGK